MISKPRESDAWFCDPDFLVFHFLQGEKHKLLLTPCLFRRFFVILCVYAETQVLTLLVKSLSWCKFPSA